MTRFHALYDQGIISAEEACATRNRSRSCACVLVKSAGSNSLDLLSRANALHRSASSDVLVNAGASDLHIGEGQPPKIRKHGDIMAIRQEPMTRAEAGRYAQRNLRPEGLGSFEERGDFDFAYEMDDATLALSLQLSQTNQWLRCGLPAYSNANRYSGRVRDSTGRKAIW